MEERQHRPTSTVARRLSTIIGFYRFAVIDGLLDRSPADSCAGRISTRESTTLGLDRMELGAFIAQAGATALDHALACLLGLLGMRVSEACGVDIENLGTERGHRTVFIIGKGYKLADPAAAEGGPSRDVAARRTAQGPLLLTRSGMEGLDRHADPYRPPGGQASWHRQAHLAAFAPAQLHHRRTRRRRAVPGRADRARHADPGTTTRYDRARNNLDRHAGSSSRLSWRERPLTLQSGNMTLLGCRSTKR